MENKSQMEWDNKFGLMPSWEFGDLEDHATDRMKEQSAADKVVIGGVGRDAEIVTNERGGKQSKSPMAMHLMDAGFLMEWSRDRMESLSYRDEDDVKVVEGENCRIYDLYNAIYYIAEFMKDSVHPEFMLLHAADCIEEDDIKQMTRIAQVLQVGASRYKANNWRLIPQEEHINHALIHIIAELAGDKQDDHLDHALCRLMMAYATEKSENFDYCNYVA